MVHIYFPQQLLHAIVLQILTTSSPSSKYVVYATACVYRELYWKIADRKKKNCVNNYLI